MEHVFVAGAGYIGSAVAITLRQAGFRVSVLVRSANKAADLLKNEVQVIEGDLKNPATYENQVTRASYIIDATGDLGVVPTLLEVVEKASKKSPKLKTFVYTSGGVYGDQPGKVLDEDAPIASDAHPWSKARYEFEQKLVQSSQVRGVIIRPGWVYGNSSGHFGHLVFGNALKGSVTLVGNHRNKSSYIHIADLADAYRRVVEAPVNIIAGQIFNINDNSHPTNEEVYMTAAKAAGFTGQPEFRAASNDFEKFMDVQQVSSSFKATRVLGWIPRHIGFVEEVDTYLRAYKAANGL
jgi:UDP-glucose 4-epimerase